MILLLYLAAVIIPCGVLYALTVKRHFDVCSFYIAGHVFLFVPAASLMFFGLQGADSNPFLININFSETLSIQGLIFAVHALGILAGYLVLKGTQIGRVICPVFDGRRSDMMTLMGLGVLTLINVVVMVGPFLKGGGILGAIVLIRNEFYFSGINYLRIFIVVGTFLAAAHFAYVLRWGQQGKAYSGLSKSIVGGIFLLNLLISVFLGGKGFIVYPVIFFFLALYAQNLHKRLVMIMVLFVLFLGSIVGLQQIRVELVHGSQNIGAQNLGTWDYAYTGLRFRLFEDNMVYLGTDKVLHHTEIGEDFVNGVLGPVPRGIWTGKPDEITAGARFKRQLMPRSDGGWPPYGMNQWFVNFGWLGVVIGGMLTGFVLQALQSAYGDYQSNPYSSVIMMVFLVRLLINGGLDNMFFVEYVFYILPLFIFAGLTDRRLYVGTQDARI